MDGCISELSPSDEKPDTQQEEHTSNVLRCSTYLQKADTVTASDLARLLSELMTPEEYNFARSCSVIIIRNSSLGSNVCAQGGNKAEI